MVDANVPNIRAYRPDDAARLLDIFRQAIRQIGSRHYSAAQVEAWAGARVTEEGLDRMYRDGRATFIAVNGDDEPIAFSDLEADGHVDMLYCDPAYAGRGIASGLLAAVETQAGLSGLTRLHSEASETARPVFERAGFSVLSRRDFEVEGVAIHNWKMEKQL